MTKKKVAVVTGGAGFIGSHMVDLLLSKKYRVHVIDNLCSGYKKNLAQHNKNPFLKFEKINICQLKPNNKLFKNADYVFHFAGLADIVPSIQDPTRYIETNVEGTLNVLEACRKANVKKLIYAASASCYGIPKNYPIDENSKIDTKYPYALSKFLGERLVLHWAEVYKMTNISLRFFNVYGPRSRTTGSYGAVFGVFLAQKLAKKPLTVVGDGNQTRDFVHVFDVVKAIANVAEKAKKTSIYNIGSGKETSVNEIVKIIGGDTMEIPKRPGEPSRSLANIDKIKNEFNWTPKISINEGVRMLLANIKDWKDAPIWTPETIKTATKEWFKFLK